jgi:hypothetical protein
VGLAEVGLAGVTVGSYVALGKSWGWPRWQLGTRPPTGAIPLPDLPSAILLAIEPVFDGPRSSTFFLGAHLASSSEPRGCPHLLTVAGICFCSVGNGLWVKLCLAGQGFF